MNEQRTSEGSASHGGGVRRAPEDRQVIPVYFSVSPLKLVVMSICTLGLYELFWYYKNWSLVKWREGIRINPVLRSFFAVFFCYSLFKRIQRSADSIPLRKSIIPSLLAVGWIIVSLLYILPAPYWLFSFFAVLFLLPVQTVANEINIALCPGCDANKKFTRWNILGIVIGGLFIVLGILGTFSNEGGVRFGNTMEQYALDYISQHNLINVDEHIAVYYDASLTLDSTECAILTDQRLIYHKYGNNSIINNKDIYEVTIQDLGMLGEGITVISNDKSTIYIEIAPLNNGILFYNMLQAYTRNE